MKLSDLCKRANLTNSGNNPCLNSSYHVLYDREKATDKKYNEKGKEERRLRMAVDQESLSTPVEPTDIFFPIIRTGWFNDTFVLTILSLAFFQKKIYTDDFNLIKEFVPCLFHILAPWNLQEIPDPTNFLDSFLVKVLLSSIVLLEITIKDHPYFIAGPISPRIIHILLLGPRIIQHHPSLLYLIMKIESAFQN